MTAKNSYLPKILKFNFCRFNPIILLNWEEPYLYYFNKCKFYNSKFEGESNFKMGKAAEDDWLEFWLKLETINVWNWNSEYNYRGIKFYESSNWHLYIVHQEKSIKSNGNNSFPPASLNQPSEQFIALLNAFIELGNSIN